MDPSTRERTKKKFDIAYMMAKEKLAFAKMKCICELEEWHGVDLAGGYKNDHACSTFTSYIAREQQEILLNAISKSKFFSIQADASVDAGNVELELFMILHFDAFSKDGAIHVRNSFFCIRHLSSSTGEGLFECLKAALEYVNVDEWRTKMIGFGCDGASANMAEGGLKGLLKKEFPLIFVFWCLGHRLELSVKDALKSSFFSTLDDLLLRLYFIYEKSPKKCRILNDIVEELRACLEPSEMPSKGGSRPLRACGTHFVSHKVAALKRVVARFGAYLAHLTAMTEDSSMQPADRQKMKGYVVKWQISQKLLGCALFRDILRPLSILCKVLQEEEICVVRVVECVLKTKNSLDKVKTTLFEELPTVKMVLGRIKCEDRSVSYQGVDLKNHDQSITYLKTHMHEWIEALETCLKKRFKQNEFELLTHTVTLLATNGWERSTSTAFGHEALEAVCERFHVSLESANVDCSLVQEEWDHMVEYGRTFLNLVQDDYKINWWKLFNSVDASKWSNVLRVIELLFCLPVSNGHLERVFSQIKLIKNNRRTCLNENTLDELVRINVEGPPLSKWDSSFALDMWLKDKARRVNRKDSTSPTSAVPSTFDDSQTDPVINLDGWEEWTS